MRAHLHVSWKLSFLTKAWQGDSLQLVPSRTLLWALLAEQHMFYLYLHTYHPHRCDIRISLGQQQSLFGILGDIHVIVLKYYKHVLQTYVKLIIFHFKKNIYIYIYIIVPCKDEYHSTLVTCVCVYIYIRIFQKILHFLSLFIMLV